MPLDNRYQRELLLNPMPTVHRLPETAREPLKAWLGELLVTVWGAKSQALSRQEVSHD